MKTTDDFLAIVNRIEYPMLAFFIGLLDGGPRCYLQVVCDSKCNITGSPMQWKGRKWMLSEFMTDGEVVQTAFMAVMAAIEHETREQFKYRGQSIFDPHYNVEKLVALRAQPDALKERHNAG